jgi:Zn-dependent oligopeptidase
VQVRAKIAKLLGYSDHAEFTLELRMAKAPAKVEIFLTDLEQRLKSLSEKELALLLEMKKKEKESLGEPFDGKFHSWDFR